MTREEAIRRIKAWNLDSDDMEVLSVVIPELAENEDEKIRIELLKDIPKVFPYEKAFRYIHWLEKRKEEKPYEPKNWPADKDNLTQEQKHKFKVGDRVTNGECVYTIEQVDKKIREAQEWKPSNEQKSVGWSEEDERIRKALIAFLEMNIGYFSCNGFTKYDIIQWLKSLPESFGLQPKQRFESAFSVFEKENPDWRATLSDSTYYELAEWYDVFQGENKEELTDVAWAFANYVWSNIK